MKTQNPHTNILLCHKELHPEMVQKPERENGVLEGQVKIETIVYLFFYNIVQTKKVTKIMLYTISLLSQVILFLGISDYLQPVRRTKSNFWLDNWGPYCTVGKTIPSPWGICTWAPLSAASAVEVARATLFGINLVMTLNEFVVTSPVNNMVIKLSAGKTFRIRLIPCNTIMLETKIFYLQAKVSPDQVKWASAHY